MRVLLVEPPKRISRSNSFEDDLRELLFFPLGLGYLFSVSKNAGFEVDFLDCYQKGCHTFTDIEGSNTVRVGIKEAEISEYIQMFKPDVVGVSCIISNRFYDVLDICRIVKKIDKGIVTVVGGGHPTIQSEDTLSNSEIDFIIRGEGENSFLRLLYAIQEGIVDGRIIDGVIYKYCGQICESPEIDFIDDLDTLPFPAYKEMGFERYIEDNRTASIITSRGCTQQCVFCLAPKIWGKRYRSRSVENILEEIIYLKENFQIDRINFLDDNFLKDKPRAKKLFEALIENKYVKSWSTEHGVEPYLLDEELVNLMVESGCEKIGLAIESGDQWVLNNIIKKPVDLNRVKEIVKYIKPFDIKLRGFFIMGIPGEKILNIENTINFARELELDSCAFFSAIPIPGTELYEICKNNGYVRKDKLELLKYNFSTVNIETEDFSRKDIENLLARAKESVKAGT